MGKTDMSNRITGGLLLFVLLMFFALSFIMFYRGDIVFARPRLNPVKQNPGKYLPDPDVTYISRTPRYNRYKVDYPKTKSGIGIPVLAKGTENLQRWPRKSETVTYTAHIINKGNVKTPVVGYQWTVNGQKVKKGVLKPLNPGKESTAILKRRWKDKEEIIVFQLDPGNNVKEICEKNNKLKIGSRDLTMSIWAERGIYELFNHSKNRVGSYSFEDWIQNQVAVMNKRFSQAKYKVSPFGIEDRVRIDKIVVAEDLDGPGNPMNKDPHQFNIDGRWQFKDNSYRNKKGMAGEWKKYVKRFILKTDWGLIHEMSHQLGVIDLYRMNLINNKKKYPNNGIHVLDKNGKKIPVTKLPTASWNQVLFKYPGIMAGGTTEPYKKGSYYSSHTAAGLNTNYGKRRGYYGEYLFDTPESNYLKITGKNGKPLSGAKVELFQKDAQTEVIDNKPELTGTTSSSGIMRLKNRPVEGVTTATGHTLRPNPFGQIHVVGTNGTMLVRVTQKGKVAYGWLFIIDLNLAYWSGKTSKGVYKIKTNL